MSTKLRRVHFHISDDLLQRLEAYCQQYGTPKSEVMRRALDLYLAEMQEKTK